MPQCDICSRPIAWTDGVSLTTSQVVTNEAYWKFAFKHQWSSTFRKDDPTGESLAMLVNQQASYNTGWLVCPSCNKMFSFDERVAREYARRQSDPPGSGPANMRQAANAAATAWNDVFGKWPSSIQAPPSTPASSARSKRDLPSPDEVFLFCRGFTPSKEQIALAGAGLVHMYEKDLTLDLISRTPFVVSTEPATNRDEFFKVVGRIKERYPKACVIDYLWLDQKTGHDMATVAVWDGDTAGIVCRRLKSTENVTGGVSSVSEPNWWLWLVLAFIIMLVLSG